MIKISALIFAFPNEKNIGRAIGSVSTVADEVIVIGRSLHSGSVQQICFDKGARFIEHTFNDENEIKKIAATQARYDYVLVLDADEYLSQELTESILSIKQAEQPDEVYQANRVSSYGDQQIHYGDWQPEKKIILWKRIIDLSSDDDLDTINKKFKVNTIGDLLHQAYNNVKDTIRGIQLQSEIFAKKNAGKKSSSALKIIGKSAFIFFKSYILNKGILDGFGGLMAAITESNQAFYNYAKLYEKNLDYVSDTSQKIKVSGFTIIRNAVKYDYPVVEAITSILPLCDEFIVAVGNSTDETLELVKSIGSPKIKIINTVWDDGLREGGRTFALETDKAFQAISPDSDWAFYIQADEAVHEKYFPVIREAMEKYKDDASVDGLLFHYKHFYGSYDYVGESWRWYRREIRVIKNNKNIFSYRDAQGFRKKPNEKLRVKLIDAFIYHYGWVKDPRAMQHKQQDWNKFYHDDQWIDSHVAKANEFDYTNVDSLEFFEGTHPQALHERISKKNWKFDHDISIKKYSFKEKLKRFVYSFTGYRIGEYKNYKIV